MRVEKLVSVAHACAHNWKGLAPCSNQMFVCPIVYAKRTDLHYTVCSHVCPRLLERHNLPLGFKTPSPSYFGETQMPVLISVLPDTKPHSTRTKTVTWHCTRTKIVHFDPPLSSTLHVSSTPHWGQLCTPRH